jgi:hypothetical protein
MKKLNTLIVSMCFMLILIISCNFKGNTYPKEKEIGDILISEDFDLFTKHFYSDSIFQMSRIEFPLKGLYNEPVESTMSNPIGDTILYVWERKNWTIVKTSFINNKDTSIQDRYGTKYIRRIKKNSTEVIDSVYIEDSGFITVRKFKLKDKKWYLTYYEIYNN